MKRLVVQHPQLTDEAVQAFTDLLGSRPDRHWAGGADWRAVDPEPEALSSLAERQGVDAALVMPGKRLVDFGLLAFDMDSTLINIECIDEMADLAGQGPAVARITEAAMRGEIPDFAESLRRRLALLAGAPVGLLARVYDERLRPNAGADRLINAANDAGLRLLLVSGGFTFFTERLQQRFGFDVAVANELEIHEGVLTGHVIGPIIDARAKRDHLLATCAQFDLPPERAIVIGDGANDLQMLAEAGLSVAYHAKPIVRSRTRQSISHCGLDAILNLFADTAPITPSAP
ncbi:MAG: phosphoserine phosphatase SerB [Burkholderiaceae bacterium]